MGKFDEDLSESEEVPALMISAEVESALDDIPDLQRRNELRYGIEKMLDYYSTCGRHDDGRDWLAGQAEEIRVETERLKWESRAKRVSMIAGTFIGSAATTFFGQ